MKNIKGILIFASKVLFIYLLFYATQIIILGSKNYIPKIYTDLRFIYQTLILPITLIWVIYFSKKWKAEYIIFEYSKIAKKTTLALSLIILFNFIFYFSIKYLTNIHCLFDFSKFPVKLFTITVLIITSLAVVEELVFRKLILNLTYTITKNLYLIAFLNGIIFLLMHSYSFMIDEFSLIWIFGIFSMAFFLSIYVIKYRDLIFPFCFHTFFNISSSLFIENDKYQIIEFSNFEKNGDLLYNSYTMGFALFAIILTIFCLKINLLHYNLKKYYE